MRILGLVTARGGSKGFPGKNLALLAGRPLVTWAHRTLAQLRTRHPELVLRLSTDDPTIAAAWPEHDRPTDLRPAALADDQASSWSVVEYELDRCAHHGAPVDAVLLLQPTSPLLRVQDLDAAWQVLASGSEAVIGVAEVDHPLPWCQSMDDTGLLHPVLGDAAASRRQDLRPSYRPVGFYLATSPFLRTHRGFLVPDRTRGVVVPAHRAVDIDYPIDLDVAEAQQRRHAPDRPFELGGRNIGDDHPCFVIAEAGVNHNGDVALARKLVEESARAGADAVKFQTFSADRLVTRTARKAAYQSASASADQSQFDMLKSLELPLDVLADLKRLAEKHGLVFLSSPFDPQSVKELIDLGVEGFKLGSGELTNPEMLQALADAKRPLILSTGMCSLDEVEASAAMLQQAGDPPVAWLHCVSAYPAPADQSNLRAMDSIRLAVGGPVGMSDHTMGTAVSLAAVARGASIIEKHVTLSRSLSGPDHAASLEPEEFADLVRQIRVVESALGDSIKRPMPAELDTREVARKSVVAIRNLDRGDQLRKSDIAIKRPGTGIPPMELDRLIGRRLARAVVADQPLTWEDLA